MLQKLNATRIGLLTGIVMTGLSAAFYYSGMTFDDPMQYSIHVVYAAGIVWAIYRFSNSDQNDNKFGSYFQQGFRCFIVAILLVIIYTFVFNKLNPRLTDLMADVYRDQLIKSGNATPNEIGSAVKKMKKSYLTLLIASSIFGYLFVGAVVTSVSSFLFMRRK